MLIFLHGPDRFRLQERLTILRQAFRDKYDQAGYQLESIAAAKVTPEQLRRSLLTQGLFSSHRFTVYHDIFDLPANVLPLWLEAAPQANQATIIVATADQLPKTKSDLKTMLLAANRAEEYAYLKPAQVSTWIQTQFATYNIKPDPEAVALLLQSYGSDLWSLHNAINQLSHFSTTITAATVQQFVTSPLDDNIFHLTDAIAERNSKKALQLLQAQLDNGVNHFYLLTMLARQVSLLIQVKEPHPNTGQLHPYVLKKTQQHAQRFSLEHLLKLHQTITEIDLQLKSNSVPAEILLDRFILQSITD